jgi:ribosome maturation factor RimP
VNDTRPQHTGLEGRIAELIAPGLESIGYELVRVAIMGKQTPTVQIMADRADQTPLSLDDCERISHLVSAVLDVDDPISSAWTLEVSSAGIDRPLTRVKDWNRYAGHLARIDLDVPTASGRKRLTGTVLGADEAQARVKLDSGETVDLPHAHIRRAKLVLTEELIKATETPPAAN